MKTRNKKGFTLIELMIVTVIIGLLIILFLPNYKSLKDKTGETAKRIQEMQNYEIKD